jgi:hypothetical protein
MKTNLRKAGESTAFLVAREEYRAELRISIFRTAFILLLLVTNLVQSLLRGISLLAEVLPLGILLILSVFMLIDIWWLGRSRFFSRFYRPSHKYLIITLDVLGFSVMLHLAFLHSDLQQQLGIVRPFRTAASIGGSSWLCSASTLSWICSVFPWDPVIIPCYCSASDSAGFIT